MATSDWGAMSLSFLICHDYVSDASHTATLLDMTTRTRQYSNDFGMGLLTMDIVWPMYEEIVSASKVVTAATEQR
jgi:hypothetical protein